MKLRSLSLLVLLLLGHNPALGYRDLPATADSLNNAGFYDEAITEYKRYLFFRPRDERASEIYAEIGYCYAYLGDWQKALDAVNRSIRHASADNVIQQRKIDRGAVLLASGAYRTARAELERTLASPLPDETRTRASILLFTSTVLEHEWKKARRTFETLGAGPFENPSAVSAALAKAEGAGRKSPGKARLLSTLIPGAGQFYLGRWFAGLNALALCGGLGYLTVDSIRHENYVGGFFAFTWLFIRYYNGNRHRTYDAAVSINQELDRLHEKEILDLLR